MAGDPLTHHEILTLVEPFTRSGRQVDLAATDRPERRLVFKPRDYAAGKPSGPALRETLVLENPQADQYRLTRTLAAGSGAEATLRVDGRDPGSLVERLDRVDPQVHFQALRGVSIARSYRLIANAGEGPDAVPRDRLVLTEARADLGDVGIKLEAATGRGGPAEIYLTPKPERPFAPPEDLLAVLGWSWKPLRPVRHGWRSTVRIAKREPKRSRDCERKLERTVEHLAMTLSQPPAGFHARFPVARWFCFARRTTAILVVLGVMALGPAILYMDLPQESMLRMLAFNAPPLLLFAAFVIRELPIMRPPRIPSPPPESAWVPTTLDQTDRVRV